MATIAGKVRVIVPENGVALTANTTQNGTSTGKLKPGLEDLLVTIAVAGITAGGSTPQVQGSNDNATWTTVTPDKGSFAQITAAGTVTVHFGQFQYIYARVQYVNIAATNGTVTSYILQHPVQDSVDATVQ